MPAEFCFPGDPKELWLPDSQLPIKVVNDIQFEDADAVAEAAEELSFKLCDQDPLCIAEQSNFDAMCSIVRSFDILKGPSRRQLVDALCSSVTCLNAWIDRLLASPEENNERELLVDYRSAFKAYLFFLQWIAKIAAREAKDSIFSANTAAATSVGANNRRRKKNVDDGDWDWAAQLPKIIKSVGQSLNTDLWALFRPNRPDQSVLLSLVHLSIASLEHPSASKDEELASAAAHVLVLTALKYQQMDAVAGALVDVLNKYEHTPAVVAETLRYSIRQFDDGRLAAAVISDIASVEPGEYERQQNATGEKAGVRSIASFVEEMSTRLPKFMLGQISLLLPHLGGKAWSLRCSIVASIGHLLNKAFEGEVGNAEAAALRLRSKQHLLDILCERIRDQSSFVRKTVLQTWAFLAENRAIPLGHWQVVTTTATGRLEDKSSLVRKEALKLLGALMLHNPFGPALPLDRFIASLQVHSEMLEQIMPQETNPNGDNFHPTQEVTLEESIPMEEDEQVEPKQEAREEEVNGPTENGEKHDVKYEQHDLDAGGTVVKKTPAEVGWDGTVEELQALVASLELAVEFAKSLSECMPSLVQLLASSTVSDVQESIAMLLTCKQFEIAGAQEAIRRMLPLVFSRDQAIKDRIVEALDQLYVSGWAGSTFTSAQAARNLVDLASGATLGELGSLEEVIKEFMNRNFVTAVTVHELWELANKAGAALASGVSGEARARRDLRAALAVISMSIAVNPESVGNNEVAALLRLGFPGGYPADALTARHACSALLHLEQQFKAGSFKSFKEPMYAVFVRTVVASPLTEESWYSAVESAINALYALHPAPEYICGALVRKLGEDSFSSSVSFLNDHGDNVDASETDQVNGSLSVRDMSRFFFVLGQVALKHLVLVEKLSQKVRKARFDAEKRATEQASTGKKTGASDLNAELGVGSAAADAELDAMKEAAESQILSARSLLGPYAKVVSSVCHNRQLLSGDSSLRSSALLALCKLMIVDAKICEENLQLLFTLLHNRNVEPELRSNLIIALGDLALRFPNSLEPWTDHIYRPLGDPDASVRKNTLMVLSHLILNDMMKVKGHISKVAVCLEDSEDRIAALAQLFFHELAKKEYKGTSPIYNLLPDILSNLSREPNLSRSQFQSIMQQLLGYIKKDKQGDALVEKLCSRFAATEDATQWRNVAFCLSQLPISEKGTRKLAECFKLYKTALADSEVTDTICGILAKSKKNSSKPEMKQLIEDLEAKIEAAAAERSEEEATANRARQDMVSRAEFQDDVQKAQRDTHDAMDHADYDSQQISQQDGQMLNENVKIELDSYSNSESSIQKTDRKEHEISEADQCDGDKSSRSKPSSRNRVDGSNNEDNAMSETKTTRRKTKPIRETRSTRGKKKAVIASDSESDEGDDSRIAAVQAAMGKVTIKEESDM